MSEMISVLGCCGDDYETILGEAMAKLKKYLPEEAQILRREPHYLADSHSAGNWFLNHSSCQPTMGGSTLCCDFHFARIS
jgi:hypothetical protein